MHSPHFFLVPPQAVILAHQDVQVYASTCRLSPSQKGKRENFETAQPQAKKNPARRLSEFLSRIRVSRVAAILRHGEKHYGMALLLSPVRFGGGVEGPSDEGGGGDPGKTPRLGR